MNLNPRPNSVWPALLAGLLICGCDDTQDDGPGDAMDAGTAQAAAGKAGGSAAGKGGTQGDSASGGSGGAANGADDVQTVKLRFTAMVGDREFSCGEQYEGMGNPATTVTPGDFRFYVQDVRLIDASGKEVPLELQERAPWQTPDVALLDFEDMTGSCHGTPILNDYITGTVPKGDYTGVVFRNGVPEALNHLEQSTQPAPLDTPDLYWAWLTGYRFFVAEVQQVLVDDGTGAAADEDAGTVLPGRGLLHIGSTACRKEGCLKQNRNEIRLTDFDPEIDFIVADIAQVFGDSDLTLDRQCHSGDEFCAPMFERVGVSWETGDSARSQKVYRVQRGADANGGGD